MGWVPLAASNPPLDEGLIFVGVRCHFALMTFLVAEKTRRNDVASTVASAFAAWLQVLCRELEAPGFCQANVMCFRVLVR